MFLIVLGLLNHFEEMICMYFGDMLISLVFSLARLFAAYALSFLTAITIGIVMARSKLAETILYPIIDVLQSIPVVGFFPIVLLFLARSLPEPWGLELASIILIFTGQVWNMILGVYSSVKALPSDLHDMAKVYGLDRIIRVFKIYIPSALYALSSNTVVSWAGGLFFLTACETISMGSREYRLKGIGTYIVEASIRGDTAAIVAGVLALIMVSIAIYILLWNPILNYFTRMSGGEPDTYPGVRRIVVLLVKMGRGLGFILDWIIYYSRRVPPIVVKVFISLLLFLIGVKLAMLSFQAISKTPIISPNIFLQSILTLPWLDAFAGIAWSLIARVAPVIVSSFFTIALLSFYARRRGRATRYAIIITGEVLASIPAFLWWSLFGSAIAMSILSPLIVSFIIMYQGTAWYIFFNTPFSFSSEVEKRLYEMAEVYGIKSRSLFTKIFLPMNMPRLIAGLSSAWGGAWNSTIAAEYAVLDSTVIQFYGIGYELVKAVETGGYIDSLFYAITLSVFIVVVNRTLWRWLYNRAFMRFRVID